MTKVSQCHPGHVQTRALPGKKRWVFCFLAEQREVGTTLTIDPCVPIILCTLLTGLIADAASSKGKPKSVK